MHQTTMLLVEVGALLFGLSLLGRLAGRIGLSPVPLYLLAGLAFGQGGVLPLAASEEFIEIGAGIGVILLLVMLGIEYSADELVGNLRRAAPVGVLDAVLNAVPGAALALLLGWGPVAALALAGITWVSSSGVIAKVLRDLGRLGNRETPAILSILVIEDLAMAFYLPVLTAVLVGAGVLAGVATMTVAVITVLLVLVLALRFGHLVSALVSARDAEALLLGVLGLTLFVAGVAESLNVSAAVGAFLVGIAISGQLAHHATQLLSPLRDLFAAVFFVFFSFQVDPADLAGVFLPALALAVVTALTKFGSGWYAARRIGVGRSGQVRAGATLVARGEFSIVIAALGVTLVDGAELGAFVAGYVLITALTGPVLAKYADRLVPSRARRRPAAARG